MDKEARAIALAADAGDEWCLADALQVVGYAHFFRGQFDAASSHLDRVRPIAERLDHPLLLAWDRIGQVLMAGYRGSLTDARALVDDARAPTEGTSDPNLAMNLLIAEAWLAYLDDVIAHLRRARAARRRSSQGWASLTPTQLQVAELVTEGLTNRQIADQLYVSAETIKTHLSHTYTKLDVRNRAALASSYERSSQSTELTT